MTPLARLFRVSPRLARVLAAVALVYHVGRSNVREYLDARAKEAWS